MCEYCGCQSIPAIRELTVEHDVVVNQIAEITRGLRDGNTTAAADACRRISRILLPHNAVEEDGLFPAMASEFPDRVESLQQEHRAIEAVLAECDAGTPTDPPGRAGWCAPSTCCVNTSSRSRTASSPPP